MKNKVSYLALTIGIIVLLSSCFSIPRNHEMVVDENNQQNNVTVTFVNNTRNGWFIVKKWNNTDINDELYTKRGGRISSTDKSVLTVPAGENNLTFDVFYTFSSNNSTITHEKRDIELRYFLEDGTEYQIKGRTQSLGLFKGYELFVGIYDATNANTLIKEWKLGET